MRNYVHKILFFSSILLATTSASWAEGVHIDMRVKKALEQVGLKYSITSKGNFRVEFRKINKTERSQWVFVSSSTTKYYGLEVRRIWSTGFKYPELLSKSFANQLLYSNVQEIIGAWEYSKRDDGWRAIYTAKLPVEASPATLKATITAVMYSADKMENYVTKGKDDF